MQTTTTSILPQAFEHTLGIKPTLQTLQELMLLPQNPAEQLFDQANPLAFLMTYNQSANAPYHNNYHALCLLKMAHFAMNNHYTQSDITPIEKTSLYVACLLHDLHHSAGTLTDDKNIEQTQQAVFDYLHAPSTKQWFLNQPAQSPFFCASPNEYKTICNQVHELIADTQFPPKGPAQSSLGALIRDLDQLQFAFDFNEAQVIEGLRCEFSKRLAPNLSYQDNIENSKKYYQALQFETNFANSLAPAFKQHTLQQLNYLQTLSTQEQLDRVNQQQQALQTHMKQIAKHFGSLPIESIPTLSQCSLRLDHSLKNDNHQNALSALPLNTGLKR